MFTYTANQNDTTAPTIVIPPGLPYSFSVDFTALFDPTDTVASGTGLSVYTNMALSSVSTASFVMTANTTNTMNSGDDGAVWVSIRSAANFQASRLIRFVASDASVFGAIQHS